MAETVLTLDALVERPIVRIEGEPFEMKNAAELSILDFHTLGKKGATVQRLMLKDELDDRGIVELTDALRALVAILLIAPIQVLDALSDTQRIQIAEVFTKLQSKAKPAAAEQVEDTGHLIEALADHESDPARIATSTGANSSRD